MTIINFRHNSRSKLNLSLGLIVTFILYSISVSWKNGLIADKVVSFFRKTDSTINVPNTNTAPILSSDNVVKGNYIDGTYNGTVEDVFYGNVEVRAIVSGGNLVNVDVIQYPNDRDNSIKINAKAIPVLKRESISIQSADVDIVTGATQTSKGFKKSLESALAQAKK